MPLGAPVTIATLSDSLLIIHRSSWSDSSYTQSLMAVNRASPLRKLDFFSLRHERFETEPQYLILHPERIVELTGSVPPLR
jgi:hypothetical protein